MENFLIWLKTNWTDLAAYAGIGGGSVGGGLIGQRLTDRKQDKQIKKLTETVKLQDKQIKKLTETEKLQEQEILSIRAELDQNTLFDKQLRQELKERHEGLNNRLDRMEAKQDKFYDMIFEIVKK